MATPAKLELIRGEVTKVQFTSETHPVPGGKRAPPTNRVVNKMRIFLKEKADGKERDFAFTNTTVGVHEGHHIAIARAIVRGAPGPVLLALINESTGQRDDSEEGFAQAAKINGFFGPRWKGAGMSAVLFVFGYLISRFITSPERGEGWWISWPLFLSFLAFPVFWAGAALWERMTRGRSGQVEEERLHAEIAARLAGPTAAHAPVVET
jgi:hypothetical protein